MTRHIIALALLLNGCAAKQPPSTAVKTLQAECDQSVWNHVYNPKRLQVIDACITVTGVTVDASRGKHKDGARHEPDGDAHAWLKLDPGQEAFINTKNIKNEGGNLVFEPVCVYRVTQADAADVCRDYKQDILPPTGSRIRLTGAHVLDKQHGHTEIHPVFKIEVMP